MNERLKIEMIERKLVDEAVRESERRFRDIVFSMAGWIWEIDEKCTYTYCSDKVQEILGYSPDEIIGKTLFDTKRPDGIQRIRDLFYKAMAEKCPMVDLESWDLHKEGGCVCLVTSGVPVLDDDGNLEGYRGVTKDITEHKRVEADREKLIAELEKALSKIKTLHGLIPICASCKKIRDDNGYWNKLEAYIESHSNAEFSHGICPDCLKTLYPNLSKHKEDHRNGMGDKKVE